MKKALLTLLGAACVVWMIMEYMAVPAMLVIIGLFCDFGWKYYAISMCLYVAVVGIIHVLGNITGRCFAKWLEKKLDKSSDPDK